ncbi:hypothetical protein J8273_0362 [Carpediemonas membranifera]|uniref:Uncharacterized protein n=1 Tax=Carpediemonas membranifera TaxID=201153 RepID=A0A8J6AVD8_9EUKA|nr:hypothetical protein J8273_0362 [Carpediemonas membranifera]|eukprot:KAG9395143.1 hypothetical protein J8273_0362 [Carpediemonas membranifera]
MGALICPLNGGNGMSITWAFRVAHGVAEQATDVAVFLVALIFLICYALAPQEVRCSSYMGRIAVFIALMGISSILAVDPVRIVVGVHNVYFGCGAERAGGDSSVCDAFATSVWVTVPTAFRTYVLAVLSSACRHTATTVGMTTAVFLCIAARQDVPAKAARFVLSAWEWCLVAGTGVCMALLLLGLESIYQLFSFIANMGVTVSPVLKDSGGLGSTLSHTATLVFYAVCAIVLTACFMFLAYTMVAARFRHWPRRAAALALVLGLVAPLPAMAVCLASATMLQLLQCFYSPADADEAVCFFYLDDAVWVTLASARVIAGLQVTAIVVAHLAAVFCHWRTGRAGRGDWGSRVRFIH